jgi:hypothetical protein
VTFNAAAADALYASLQSIAQQTNLFQAVNTHEPQNAPGNRLYCSIVWDALAPVPTSGLNQTSGKITFKIRIWSHALQRPLENIDPELMAATVTLIGALNGAFTLGGLARNIDLFAMTAMPGWIEFENTQYRVAEITAGIVINDMFAQIA